tara:strand:- start:1969 stop:2481 length:513 start_codon:yes stop_codon:yes gene_type:complete
MPLKNTAPIPGQSLTKEPGNAPYERPPEISDPEQALMGYISYLNDPKVLEGMVGLLDTEGYDVITLVEGLLRGGVAEGYHSIDVSLSIKKPIVNFVTKIMDATGIDYKVGDEEKDNDDDFMDDIDFMDDDAMDQVDFEEEEIEEEPLQEEPLEEEPLEDRPTKGLMERGQ